MVLKACALIGMCFTAAGTILLWLSSPAGHMPAEYNDDAGIKKILGNNACMRWRQKAAILMIIVGTLLQMPLVFWG